MSKMKLFSAMALGEPMSFLHPSLGWIVGQIQGITLESGSHYAAPTMFNVTLATKTNGLQTVFVRTLD